MKRKFLLSTISLLLSVIITNAQITKGSIFTGGQISFNSSGSSGNQPPARYDNLHRSLYIAPAVGKVIRDNLVVGADINMVITRDKADHQQEQKNHSYGAGIFARRYLPLGKHFYLFGQGRLAGIYNRYEYIPQNTYSNKIDQKGYTIALSFYPGIAYSINRKWQVETAFNNLAYVNYQHARAKVIPPTGSSFVSKNNSFSIGTGIGTTSNFVVGFRLLLVK